MTLGDYERGLEADKITVQGLQAAATAIGGIASGIGQLGLAAAIPLAALFWGKDLEQIKDNLVELFPEGGAFLSPEWIAKWGDNPDVITETAGVEPDNDIVNALPPTQSGNTVEGLSAYEVYSQAAAGRLAAYDHARNNIVVDFYQSSTAANKGYSPSNPLTTEMENELIAQWYNIHPSPPPMLLLDQLTHNANVRITAQTNWSARTVKILGGILWPFTDIDPTDSTGFVEDYLLDWYAVAVGDEATATAGTGTSALWRVRGAMSINPSYDLWNRAGQGEDIIHRFAFWTPAEPNPYSAANL